MTQPQAQRRIASHGNTCDIIILSFLRKRKHTVHRGSQIPCQEVLPGVAFFHIYAETVLYRRADYRNTCLLCIFLQKSEPKPVAAAFSFSVQKPQHRKFLSVKLVFCNAGLFFCHGILWNADIHAGAPDSRIIHLYSCHFHLISAQHLSAYQFSLKLMPLFASPVKGKPVNEFLNINTPKLPAVYSRPLLPGQIEIF